MVGPVLICALLIMVAATVATWSYMSLFTAQDDRDAWQTKVNSLAAVEPEYNELMTIENNYGLYNGVKLTTDLNNNHFHQLLNDIEAICPKSFVMSNIVSDGKKVSISASSHERLLSIPALIIQLNKIPTIRNVWIDTISEGSSGTTASGNTKFEYNYSLTFDFIADELTAQQMGIDMAALFANAVEGEVVEEAPADEAATEDGATEEGATDETTENPEETEGGDQ